MSEDVKKHLIEQAKEELTAKKRQLSELKFNFDLANDRLKHAEKRIKLLEQQIEHLASGQLPLPLDNI